MPQRPTQFKKKIKHVDKQRCLHDQCSSVSSFILSYNIYIYIHCIYDLYLNLWWGSSLLRHTPIDGILNCNLFWLGWEQMVALCPVSFRGVVRGLNGHLDVHHLQQSHLASIYFLDRYLRAQWYTVMLSYKRLWHSLACECPTASTYMGPSNTDHTSCDPKAPPAG